METIRTKKLIILATAFFAMIACGVKGRPLPPAEPAQIGTGEPPALNKKDEKIFNQKR